MSDNNDDLFDRIFPIDINEEMESSYIDYAMSVIVGRALPEVRDGLKPVHRRILYAMFDSGYRPERGYVKSARPVSDTMGQFRALEPGESHDQRCACPDDVEMQRGGLQEARQDRAGIDRDQRGDAVEIGADDASAEFQRAEQRKR